MIWLVMVLCWALTAVVFAMARHMNRVRRALEPRSAFRLFMSRWGVESLELTGEQSYLRDARALFRDSVDGVPVEMGDWPPGMADDLRVTLKRSGLV